MIDKRTASFMRSLALGQIEEEILLPFPDPRLAERERFGAAVRAVGVLLGPRAEDFAAWDREGAFPPSFLDELKAAGLFGLAVPEPFGGRGLSATGYARVLQEIARHDGSVAIALGVHGSIGVRGLLLAGTEEQKARWLPQLASGERVGAFCLTEAGAGSDVAGVRTRAVRDGDGWVITGEKIWVSNGGIASLFTVFARTTQDGRGLTAFLVPRELPGVSVGPPEDKMGIRASSTTRLTLAGVRVPADHVLGQPGEGFKLAMRVLNAGRTGLGGGSVGAMKRVIELALRHATGRKQFGRPLADLALVRGKLARMVVDCYAAESVVNLTAGLQDRGFEDTGVEAAVAKVLATEALWRTADEALQIAGGAGFMRALPYERALRDARINRIFDGSNEVLRLFIALRTVSDVAVELHELADSVRAVLSDPIKGFGVLSDYARRRAGLAVSAAARPKGRFTQLPPFLAEDAARFEELTRQLALAVDRALRRHGGKLVGEQLVLHRLADALIDLYAYAAMLSRISGSLENHGEAAGRPERELLRAFAAGAERRVRASLGGVDGPEDAALAVVAGHVLEAGTYPWDDV